MGSDGFPFPIKDSGSQCIPSTEEIIKLCQGDFEAFDNLPVHQRVRVQFAVSLKQVVYAAKLSPEAGMELYWMMEKELERVIEAAFRPVIHAAHRDGVRDGLRMAEFDRHNNP